MEQSTYKYVRVDETCYNDLIVIFKAAFNQVVDVEYYKAKFNTNYLGCKHLGYLAYSGSGEPAAFYGVFPYPVNYYGKIILAAQSGDTMTHPNHTGKGLFTTLAKMTYDLCKKEGVAFVFGFPNQNSYPGFVKKLDWVHKEDMVLYEQKVLTLPLAAVAKKYPTLKNFYRLYKLFVLRSFFRKGSFFQNNTTKGKGVFIEHDEPFFNYKLFYDSHLISYQRLTLWLKVDGGLLIGDIDKNTNSISHNIQAVKRVAMVLGCTKIFFCVSPNTEMDKQLSTCLIAKKGSPIGYIDLGSGLDISLLKFCFADFDTF